MKRLFSSLIFRRISTKMVAGFIAIVIIFSVLGLLVSQKITESRARTNEALDRSEAVSHIEEAQTAAGEQIQAHYELMLENNASKIGVFEDARSRRQESVAAARSHAGDAEELAQFDRLEATSAEFDDNFLNKLVPAWRAGDSVTAQAVEKRNDGLLQSMSDYSGLLASEFKVRDRAAQDAADLAAGDARSYLIFAGIAGIGLSLLVTMVAARRLSRPVRELNEASLAMTHGDLNRRVQVRTNDEIAELGSSFNLMADSMQRKFEQLTNLSDIALAVSSELDWERVVGIVMEKGMELTSSEAAAIALFDEERGDFTDTYTRGLSDVFVSKMQFRKGGLAEEVLVGDKAVFSDDIQSDHRLSRLSRAEGIRAFICLPLKVRKKKLGVFYVYSKEMEAYGRDELSVLMILANQAAIAIQNALMFEQSQEEAVTDGLTGLYNQRYFYSRLREEIDRANRNQKSLSVIFCDLDRFKSFNDVNGHAMGDQALKEVARVISESKRAIDIAARYGGEEFALILPDTDTSGAQIIAHRIRRRVAGFNFNTKARNGSPLTTSIGVASYPEDAGHAGDLVDKADWSMYYGKRQGGNRVTLFHEESGDYGRVSLEDLVREELHLAAAQAIAASVDERTERDQRHAESVARLASVIAAEMKMDEDEVHRIRVAGLLHDIGLVTVPAEIINKRDHLNAEEWQRIKEHPEVSETILKHISSLQSFLPVVRHHHEHYDGAGYPDGLIRDQIPLGARILAVADAFQAMISDRPYRRALTTDEALNELQMSAGTQFDPAVVDAFISLFQGRREQKVS
ncbi:MAG: diguanylate cyclase [Thermoleophilia bacterium]